MGVSSPGAGQGGFRLALEAGLFRDQDLDIDLVFFASGVETVQTLLSGQLAVALVAGPAIVNAGLAGADLVWIAGLLNSVAYILVTSPEIATPADLRGKRLGVNRLGSSAELAARFTLGRLGLDPKSDVALLQVGNQSARLAALTAGSIQATLLEPPATAVIRKLGFRELADVARLGFRFPHEAVVTSRRMIRDRPDVLRRLVTGLVRGTHAFKTRRDEGIQVLRRHLKVDDPEALAEAYDYFSAAIIER